MIEIDGNYMFLKDDKPFACPECPLYFNPNMIHPAIKGVMAICQGNEHNCALPVECEHRLEELCEKLLAETGPFD